MTVLKTDSLKLYKDKLENYISALPETASESEVINVFSELHKYRFEIYPSVDSENSGYNPFCRMNVEQNNKRLTFENIDYSNTRAARAVINTSRGICNVSLSNNKIYQLSGYDYSAAYPLRGNGQCLAGANSKYLFILDKIANLSSISFFPSWNGVGDRANDFYRGWYSTSVRVKVYCDDEEIFNNEITGLVKCDRVYVTFDKFNQCHLEKINVGSAAAFANY